MKYEEFCNQIQGKIKEYAQYVDQTGFIYHDNEIDDKESNSLEEIIAFVDKLINHNKELTTVFEECPDSIYVTDGVGNTLRVNAAFEYTTGVSPKKVMGRNVVDLEKEGVFTPSVCRLVIQEKRKISIHQTSEKDMEGIVTAVPLFDESGEIYQVVSNARLLKDISSINNYFSNKKVKPEIQEKFDMISESPDMVQIMELVEQIKDTDSTILILGESGCGKGVLARLIHGSSKRASQNMIEINCGAIPENLLESELFGYESGAFTGAGRQGKPGLIELADKGTLMLDEISELPISLQVKLLSVIQNKKITRVGGTREIEVDLRIIAATNENLAARVKAGTFRLDLYYRLHVIPIQVPPLRKRKEDIVAAAHYFLEKYQQKYNKHIVCTEGFFEELLNYSWPGNIRELENLIERVVIINKTGLLGRQDTKILKSISIDSDLAAEVDDEDLECLSYEHAMEEFESKLIKSIYKKYKSSYKMAAVLGISQASAHRKIKKYIEQNDSKKTR